ncbi:MAG: alpha-galactosidase, partial [Flavobacterium sp.]
LNSDIIHLRRADGRDWDGIMHVNPLLKTKALVMLYNPLKEKMTRTIKLPLYYAGITNIATVREKEGVAKKYTVNRDFEIQLTFTIEPENYTWFVIE